METVKTKKENTEQVTFKDPEIFSALKKISENKGNTGIGPEAKELLREALKSLNKPKESEPVNKPAPTVSAEKNTETSKESEFSVSEKLDILAELMGKLITSNEVANSEEIESRISEEIQNAVTEYEENLRSSNMMLLLPDGIKNLVYRLLEFKKQRNEEYSVNIESLFLLIFKTYIEESSDSFPDGFKKEFKAQFKEYFTPLEPAQPLVTESPADEIQSLPTSGIGMF